MVGATDPVITCGADLFGSYRMVAVPDKPAGITAASSTVGEIPHTRTRTNESVTMKRLIRGIGSAASDPRLLTDLLRDSGGLDGTVVADYFGVAFLRTLHSIAADLGDAAAQALAAGLDVELPTGAPILPHCSSGCGPVWSMRLSWTGP